MLHPNFTKLITVTVPADISTNNRVTVSYATGLGLYTYMQLGTIVGKPLLALYEAATPGSTPQFSQGQVSISAAGVITIVEPQSPGFVSGDKIHIYVDQSVGAPTVTGVAANV